MLSLASLVHSQTVVNAERFLTLLDQRELLGNVASKWVPGCNYNYKSLDGFSWFFHLPVFPPKSCLKCLQEVERRRQNPLFTEAMTSENCITFVDHDS